MPGSHGLGLDASTVPDMPAIPQRIGTRSVTTYALPPASANNSRWLLPAGDQGRVNSCVVWALGYSAYGMLMTKQGVPGAPMAPMYPYSQIARGNDKGTSAARVLPLLAAQGIDTKAHYAPGDFDFTTQPSASERANAARYKLSGYTRLPVYGSSAKTAIKTAVAAGKPVVVGMHVRKNFWDINATNAVDYSYRPAGDIVGGHEMLIFAYNDKGVTLQNSWKSTWANKGTFTMSWDALLNSDDLIELHSMGNVLADSSTLPAPAVTPTPKPTATPTPTRTPAPVVTPTPTATPTRDAYDRWRDRYDGLKP